jgi:quaternary ammonium compound-resistance protein SugE
MAWILLAAAGLLEIGWAIGLKLSDGFTRPLPTAITILSIVASLACLGIAARTIPIGTAYAVWAGIGIVGTAIAGIAFLGESAGLLRLAAMALIVIGVVGLKVAADVTR